MVTSFKEKIILATLNAKYIHTAFGLRYLYANLGDLQSAAEILEFDINQDVIEIAERILAKSPTVLGLGVYIWNASQTLELVKQLKIIRPELIIILGGPEVSFETDSQEICRLADYVICGEADLTFKEVLQNIFAGNPPTGKVIAARLPLANELVLPYSYYTSKDIESRIVYVEASRGCPFTCEFCLSSLDLPVRQFELEPFLEEMKLLLDRGVKHFKFVDRTFNLNLRTSATILQFFLDRMKPGLFVHFEMVPDRLPVSLREIIKLFPPGSLQFEVGIQSFNPEVGVLISRKQDFSKLEENLRFLRTETGVHIHADLIVGLPGESVESFAKGFNRLVELGPQEIQVGVLKRLRGTPIIRHTAEWEMRYSPLPPYEILSNKLIDFPTLQRLKRFSKYWDLISNSGNFLETAPLIWQVASPFESFLRFSDWLHQQSGQRFGFSLKSLTTYLHQYLTNVGLIEEEFVLASLAKDYQRLGRVDAPKFLQPWLKVVALKEKGNLVTLTRQARFSPSPSQ